MAKAKILVAPMNWGLGHASRCIPLINRLKVNDFEPIIASDGAALRLLNQEFPSLKAFELPAYAIKYSKKGNRLKWKLGVQSIHIQRTIKAEYKETARLVKKENIGGIISDNRFGVRSPEARSVYLTHQLCVLSGRTTWLSTKIHRYYMQHFDACWVPDFSGEANLSGKLAHPKSLKKIDPVYLGPLSRFEPKPMAITYAVLVLLSGPEPQRSLLESTLKTEFLKWREKVLFVRGKVENRVNQKEERNLTIYNYLSGEALENALNQSGLVVCRSGYSSVMDLAKLGKKAFFIPTPGQPEQIYLAERMQQQQIAPHCKQADFSLEKLEEVENYTGFRPTQNSVTFDRLFSFFEGE